MKKILIPMLMAILAITSTGVFAASEGETFNLSREEVIVYGSDAQIWMPERFGKYDVMSTDSIGNIKISQADKAKWQLIQKSVLVSIDDNLKSGAIKKSLKPGKYTCNSATFGGDPDSGKKKFCKGMDDLAKNSGRPSIAGNGPHKYATNELVFWRSKLYNTGL
jgi:hypothetical protein